ncbi:putative transport protein [Orenia metallireducens]|jgi:predicted transport protein|uniref:Predicted transport protein n=1 Tax=Orenia metallireducens TaxID=1413210 RepID=A0A285HTF6_9FIRM|nr:DUF5655 domain-containing protein [Orenia metallireducens]PRX24086.1 putative transport protein [Orenia metallireducens]SNY38994.1 Predicted transport protein [Orenia metallireducens]
MSFNIYKIQEGQATQLKRATVSLEKELQNLIEANLEEIFGIEFLASEFSTGERHGVRMDTLGIDENNSPVILEYKRNKSQNIINQALFYLDWLMDHQGDFELLVRDKLGKKIEIDWSSPRVLCIAETFNKYDTYAVAQMGRPIELIQYQLFEEDLLNINILTSNEEVDYSAPKKSTEERIEKSYCLDDHKAKGTELTIDLFEELQEFILLLGDDITVSYRKFYIAYRTIRNFACLEIHKKHLLIYLSLNPIEVDLADERLRDVSDIGHYGTGNLEVRVESVEDIDVARDLIEKSYRFIL